jgi:alkylation response protein AidB-like acyl-CoA dehydrogenase
LNFTLTPDQELLRDTARALLREHCPTSLVRAYADDPSVADPLWERLREFTGLAAGPVVDLCLFMEELGAALAPGLFTPTVALFAPVAAAVEDDELLARVVDGDVTGTITVRAPFEMPAVEGDHVDLVAIVDGGDVSIVERPAVRMLEPFDLSRRMTELADGAAIRVRPSPGYARVRDAPLGALARALQRATVAMCAELMGTARRTLEMTLEYVKTREQFDRPIGSFQALQHRLADMDLLFERAWSSVYWAAMAVDADDDERHRAVHVAKSSADEAARHIAKEAIQMHGGIGFTWDHDLHLYMRRALAAEAFMGTTAWHRDRLAELVLDRA